MQNHQAFAGPGYTKFPIISIFVVSAKFGFTELDCTKLFDFIAPKLDLE